MERREDCRPIEGSIMSIKVMSLCWEGSQHSGSDLLMLLAIADFSDDHGKAYPAVATLAKKCRMQRRNAQRILHNLENSGELVIEPNKGPPPKFPNVYRVNTNNLGMQTSARVQGNARVQSSVGRGAIQGTNGVQPTTPKPSVTIKNRHKHFDEFWNLYPNQRKGSKSKCKEVWQQHGFDDAAEPIIAHLTTMATSDEWTRKSGQYVPSPLTYLSQQRWDGAVIQDGASTSSQFEGLL